MTKVCQPQKAKWRKRLVALNFFIKTYEKCICDVNIRSLIETLSNNVVNFQNLYIRCVYDDN